MVSLFAGVLLTLGLCAAAVWVATSCLGETNLLVKLGVKSAADTPLPRVRADPPTSELLDNVGRVAALVSGGKDSCYALGLAQAAGHDVAALLNLCPADAGAEDTDSHCFQTIGHQIVPSLAATTGLPLLVRRLTGGSKATGMVYDAAVVGDEVEDLTALLLAAVARFPGLQGVVSGAVASDYQRLRVEHAAGRAGLVALAPLWHVPQLQLLADMESAGLDAVLVKVAAEGLEPERWLGKSLAEATPHLTRLASRLGLNPAGEGGEYETLTLDCPAFKRGRLQVTGGSPAPVGGGAGVLGGLRVEVEVRDGSLAAGEVSWADDAPPPLPAGARLTGLPASPYTSRDGGVRVSASAGMVQAWACVPVGGGVDAPAAATLALAAAEARLRAAGVAGGLGDASHVRLYLPLMDAFGAVNGVWKEAIPGPGPPARACLAPAGKCLSEPAPPEHPHVTVDAVAPLNASTRRVLHVQTISPWAPACIGPYAQGVADASPGEAPGGEANPHPAPPIPLLRLAGQIGLDPASMELVEASDQPARALASARAVGVAMGCDLRSLALGWTLLGSGGEENLAALSAAFVTWRGADDAASPASPASSSAGSDGYLGGGPPSHPPFTDSYLQAASSPSSTFRPVIIYMMAAGLPRGAVAEVEALAVAPEWSGGVPGVPGWVGGLESMEEKGDRDTYSLAAVLAPGAFAHLAMGAHGLDDLQSATIHAMAALENAGLSADDVSLARACVRADAAGAGFAEALEAAWRGAGFEGPAPVVVPVDWVGLDACVGQCAVFEVTAVRGGGGRGAGGGVN